MIRARYGDASDWVKTQKEVKTDNLFVLSKKEIDSYLLDPSAIGEVCGVTDAEVARQLKGTTGEGKEELEHIIRSFKVRPTPEVKQLIARHIETVPEDFVKMLLVIQKMRLLR